MSEELESVGALSTATLAAAAVESHGRHAGDSQAHGTCANCQAPLNGPFCRMCGQAAHIHRSLLHLLEEVLHGIYHFDAKGWRTIPLLIFKPGALTRRYIDGQRKNYVSPLALFLFMVFLMFFVASMSSGGKSSGMQTADAIVSVQNDIAETSKEAADAKAAVEKATAALEEARAKGADPGEKQEALDDALNDQKSADADLKRLSAEAAKLADAAKTAKKAAQDQQSTAPAAGSGAANAPDPAPSSKLDVAIDKATREQGEEGSDESWVERVAKNLKGKHLGHSDSPAIDAAVKHALNNPELALYKLKNTTYKYSFMLVPISLPFLWLMFFWRRGIVMFDHAVFVLYSLCFMSLLFDVAMLLGTAGFGALAGTLAVFVPPIHMFVQLRGAYGLGVFSALWRTLALTIVAAIVLVLFLLLVLLASMH